MRGFPEKYMDFVKIFLNFCTFSDEKHYFLIFNKKLISCIWCAKCHSHEVRSFVLEPSETSILLEFSMFFHVRTIFFFFLTFLQKLFSREKILMCLEKNEGQINLNVEKENWTLIEKKMAATLMIEFDCTICLSAYHVRLIKYGSV